MCISHDGDLHLNSPHTLTPEALKELQAIENALANSCFELV